MDEQTRKELDKRWDAVSNQETNTVRKEFKQEPVVHKHFRDMRIGAFVFKVRVIQYCDSEGHPRGVPLLDIREWKNRGEGYHFGARGFSISLDKIKELEHIFQQAKPILEELVK